MQTGFLQIPNWFSADNQGGGVAVADLKGDGTQDPDLRKGLLRAS